MQIPPVTFTNIITIVCMVFALGSGWAAMSQQLSRLSTGMETVSASVARTQDYLDDKISKVEESIGELRADMIILFERQDVVSGKIDSLERMEESTNALLDEVLIVSAVERQKLEEHLSKPHGQGHSR